MSRKSSKAIASSKSQTTDLQPESLEVEELTTQQPVSLASQILPIGNSPNPNAHATMINRAAASPQSSQQVILQLQRQYGNRYVNRVLQQTRQLQTPIQAKLTLGAVGDKYEQQADRVAKQIVNQIQTSQSSSVQREMMPEKDELQKKPVDIIQREGVLDEENELGMNAVLQRSAAAEGGAITPDLETSIQQARGSGQPLPDNIRQPMEQAFGADFSGVKIHTDAQSDRLNQAVQAKAFTTGHDIFFRQGEYSPGSSAGQELLAHELTHVVQQNSSTVHRAGIGNIQTGYVPDAVRETVIQRSVSELVDKAFNYWGNFHTETDEADTNFIRLADKIEESEDQILANEAANGLKAWSYNHWNKNHALFLELLESSKYWQTGAKRIRTVLGYDTKKQPDVTIYSSAVTMASEEKSVTTNTPSDVDKLIREGIAQLDKRKLTSTGQNYSAWELVISVSNENNPWPFTNSIVPIEQPFPYTLGEQAQSRNIGKPTLVERVKVRVQHARWGNFQFLIGK